jgi:N-acetylated-alpha-linked acidic dipeptidase
VVPLHYQPYAGEVGSYLKQFEAKQIQTFGHVVVNVDRDKAQAKLWQDAARKIAHEIDRALDNNADTATLDALTIRLEQVERQLLVAAGLPGRPWYEHQIYAPGVNQGYGTQVLPGINDALFLRDNVAEAQQYETYLYASLQEVTSTLAA